MKNLILTFSLVLLATGASNVANANETKVTTQCLIRVDSDHPFCVGSMTKDLVNTAFADSDGVANMNAGRCLERALDYAKWCGDGNLIKTKGAAAFFLVDGMAVISAYADTATEKTALGDGALRVLRFKD